MAPQNSLLGSSDWVAKTSPQVAPRAAQDPSEGATPLWMIKASRFLRVGNHLLEASFGVALPFLVLGWQIYSNSWLSLQGFLCMLLFGYFKLIVVFTLLHRFFSHKSFSASRPVAFFLGIVTLTGAQKGPLWWSSKHVRHHKLCDNPGDPHSARHHGFWYGFVGWITHPCEVHIDWGYVHAPFKTWEMVLCDGLAGLVPYAEQYLWWRMWGINAVLINYWATVITVYLTLYMNLYLHHDEEVDPSPMANGKYRCAAHDKVPFLSKVFLDFIGEMNHYDHHRYPRKALHPALSIDLPYWMVIYPGEMLGLFYDVNHDGRQVISTKAQ